MLLQSHSGEIHLLPALPDVWQSGSARGLCARGGFEVSIAWRGGKLRSAEIRSKTGARCVLRYRDRMVDFDSQAGKTYRFGPALVRRSLTESGIAEVHAPRARSEFEADRVLGSF